MCGLERVLWRSGHAAHGTLSAQLALRVAWPHAVFAEDGDPIEHIDGCGDPLRGRELLLGEGVSGLRELGIHGGVELHG